MVLIITIENDPLTLALVHASIFAFVPTSHFWCVQEILPFELVMCLRLGYSWIGSKLSPNHFFIFFWPNRKYIK